MEMKTTECEYTEHRLKAAFGYFFDLKIITEYAAASELYHKVKNLGSCEFKRNGSNVRIELGTVGNGAGNKNILRITAPTGMRFNNMLQNYSA